MTAQVQESFEVLRQELHSLTEKVHELDIDAEEHRAVLAALEPLPGDRRCHRRVGGILLESTVSQTIPILQTNLLNVSYCCSVLIKF